MTIWASVIGVLLQIWNIFFKKKTTVEQTIIKEERQVNERVQEAVAAARDTRSDLVSNPERLRDDDGFRRD